MWHEKFLKVFPAAVFLFCVLEIFELVLIINDMNKTEKLATEEKKNLEAIETIVELLNRHLEGMDLEHLHDKKVRIK
ncbi:hypothetical protein [Helicobacter phage Pt1918U]|nr:hypothetical protein [Helicobacter phage Pt1918U]MCQ2728168.1 hypothetical protein [Helicobacter pylori]